VACDHNIGKEKGISISVLWLKFGDSKDWTIQMLFSHLSTSRVETVCKDNIFFDNAKTRFFYCAQNEQCTIGTNNVLNDIFSPQAFALEVVACVEEEEQGTRHVDCPRCEECRRVAKMLGYDAANEYAKTYAHVPRHKYGTVGGAALRVLCHIDKHVLIGRVHSSVAQTDDQRRAIVAKLIGHGGKKEVTHSRNTHAY